MSPCIDSWLPRMRYAYWRFGTKGNWVFSHDRLGAGPPKGSTGYGVFVIRCTDYAVTVTYFPWGSESQHGDCHRRVATAPDTRIVYVITGIISLRFGLQRIRDQETASPLMRPSRAMPGPLLLVAAL